MSPNVKEEEFTRAISLGLFDYLRKSCLQGFVLSISVGSDSAGVACLVYWMVVLALQELGEDAFKQKLSHFFSKEDCLTADVLPEFLPKLLHCVYQDSENSSEATWNAAQTLCRSLQIPLSRISVQSIVDIYQEKFQTIIQRYLNWQKDDLVLQNIQARVRGHSVLMLANLRNAILLTTLNRSEAAVGYMNIDGNSCGSLSPLAGIDKVFILHWLRWLEQMGLDKQKPVGALWAINELEPKAELHPLYLEQTDEYDLMPYHCLVSIENLFLEQQLLPLDVLLHLKDQYPEKELQVIANYIARFFLRWLHNQWKRERVAPAFHLDKVTVDPKTGYRFPILSGNFKEELQEMWSYVQKNI